MSAKHSLSNDTFLSKIDRLRETNVGSLIPLPQVIVVGDQSSGKSSTLESLTGFAFPRAATLCTRYATQISCIRAPVKEIVVSIIPRPDASEELKARLQAFRHTLDRMDDASLANVFHEANTAMGIRISGNDDDGVSAFSEDTLKIDISGPDETHLTLVDVPGLTTDSDIQLVRNMVKRYMENPRTIILAVIPCNVDITNQEILRLAAEADPEGVRTMGVLTKPDLAQERAVQDIILELINGQRNPLKLGYCALLNRGADDNSSSAEALHASERAFFQAPPWSTCSATALGSDSLRAHLRVLLLDISKHQLAALGPSRADESSQRRHLVQIAARAQDITKSAINGYYTGDDGLFQRIPALRLITKLVQENDIFADTFRKNGHIQEFRGDDSKKGPKKGTENEDDEEGDDVLGLTQAIFNIGIDDHGNNILDGNGEDDVESVFPSALESYGELLDIIAPTKKFPPPAQGPLTGLIQKVYKNTRGPELGTFNGTVLATIFRMITTRWEPLILAHVSTAILSVHGYIHNLLLEICPDPTLRDMLWEVLLRDELRARYKAAMAHSSFLISIERSGLPITLNHHFNTTVRDKRQGRFLTSIQKNTKKMKNMFASDEDWIQQGDQNVDVVPLDFLNKLAANMDTSEHVCADLLDTIESYYGVARERFVDTLCQHVIYHMLLTGPDSPLKILSPDHIMTLSTDQLDSIAREDAVTLNQRQLLGRQLDSLDEAMKVLRS
ncbi:hypothetical protein Sste5344_003099 [Sporothrix stenoceras]